MGQLQPQAIEQYSERDDLFILNKEVTEFEIPFSLDSEKPFLKNTKNHLKAYFEMVFL